MKILVAGGGIGGLSAALCLLKSGYEVTVFERRSQPGEVGAGIQCGANALHVLKYLSLDAELQKLAVQPTHAEFRDSHDGSLRHQIEFGKAYQARFGAPYWHLHRADLYQVLTEALHRQSPNSLRLDARVTTVDESQACVAVTLENGSQVEGDCLVGADGIRSRVREQLFGQIVPHNTGYVAWRVVVPVKNLPDDWMAPVVSNFIGHGKHAVLYYLRQCSLVNLVGVVPDKDWIDDSWVASAPWQQLKADFAGWHPIVQAVIDAAEQQICYRWALRHHLPLTQWSTARSTLLGDAAHATLPFMAAGAALAIEDARILQRALDQSRDLTAGLLLYQHHRLARTARVQSSSVALGKIYHLQNRWLQRAAFTAIDWLGQNRQDFLPNYNANTAILRS